MSKPAARIGDMHVCPMVTPGTPPIPHVGGPVTGPGCATVLIGGMPAAVMGDMCVCTGPPDTIILGSTGVLIGGKPAARMGDSCVHGGAIVVGCPTVLIGEVSPGGMNKMAPIVNAFMLKLDGFDGGAEGALAVRQVLSLQQAAAEGTPFCEVCEQAAKEAEDKYTSGATRGGTAEEPEKEDEIIKKIKKLYFTDENDIEITEVETQEKVFLVVEGEHIAGEEVLINLFDNPGDFSYQGNDIKNNQLQLTLSADIHKVELGVKTNTN